MDSFSLGLGTEGGQCSYGGVQIRSWGVCQCFMRDGPVNSDGGLTSYAPSDQFNDWSEMRFVRFEFCGCYGFGETDFYFGTPWEDTILLETMNSCML